MVGIYFLFHRILFKLNSFEIVGPILMEKLLFLIFLTFFIMLIFSNIITSLSTFYLSNDLVLLFSNPVQLSSIFSSKFIATVFQSSWTIVFFGLPIFLAYGIVMKSPWYFYPSIPFLLIPFLVIPAGIGIMIIMVLVRIYPVKRIKEITFFLTIAFAAVLVIYFRSLQPERLVNPEGFSLLGDYLTFLRGPSSPYLPSYWVCVVFLNTIKQNPSEIFFYFLVLLSNAAMLYIFASWVGEKIYYISWAKSQSKVSGKPVKFSRLERIIGTHPLRGYPLFKAFLLRDIKLFWRDVTQWSQVILFFAIGVIYIFNLKSFRIQTASTFLISFINLGFTGFVIAATGVRFSFPAISLEGKAFWLVKSSPCPMKSFLNEKFWTSFIPLLGLGEILIIISNILLKVTPVMFITGIVATFLMALSLTSLAVGMGAIYPYFKADNPAELGMTYGGILYMIFGLAYVGAMILLFELSFGSGIYISIIGVFLLNFFATYLPLKNGLKSLQQYEWK